MQNLFSNTLWGGVLVVLLFFFCFFIVFIYRVLEYYFLKLKSLFFKEPEKPAKKPAEKPQRKRKPRNTIIIDPDTVDDIYVRRK